MLGLYLQVFIACSTGLNFRKDIRILSYNVENLFDATYDGTEYKSFVPGEQWNLALYQEKRAKTVEVLAYADADVIALQEVENKQVVLDLQQALRKRKYPYVSVTSFPDSAIQLGLISRLPIVDMYVHSVSITAEYGVRGILEVHVRKDDLDIVFLVNHWKSQRGGESSVMIRRQQAGLLYSRVQALQSEGMTYLIVLGDFNEDFTTPNSAFVPAYDWQGEGIPVVHDGDAVVSMQEQEFLVAEDTVLFYSPLSSLSEGSYWYDGSWEKIDGIFLSLSLLRLFSVEAQDYLTFEEMKIPTGAPRSWHRDPLRRGYSDHFPAYLVLRRNAL